MDIFNTREIAIGIWLLVFAVFVVLIRSTRESLLPVLNALFKPKILTPVFLLSICVALIVFVLYEAGVWKVSQLKNTTIWYFSVALLSIFRIPQIKDDDNYFRNEVKNSLKLVVVLEFVIAFYTFPLLVELVIVPVVTFLIILQAFSETKQLYIQVSRLLANILTAFGCGLIIYAGYMLITEPSKFFHAGTLSDFVLPIVLTITFLPFLFVLTVYVRYEILLIRIEFLYQIESERRRAKRTALFGFHIRTSLLKRWLHYIQVYRPREPDAFRKSVRYVKAQAKNEKNPPKIPISKGWSPYRASKFLSEIDLETGDYNQDGLDTSRWYSMSKYLDVGEGPSPNNIAFYVEGNAQCASRLKLVANVNDIAGAQVLRSHLLTAVEKLMMEALGVSPPAKLIDAINDEVSLSAHISGKRIDFIKESWPSLKGYELRFYLANNSTVDDDGANC